MSSNREVRFGSDISSAFSNATAIVSLVTFASWLLEASQFQASSLPLTFFSYVAGIMEGIGVGIWNLFDVNVPVFLAVTTGTSLIVFAQLIKGYFSKAPTFYDYLVEVLKRFPQLSPKLKGRRDDPFRDAKPLLQHDNSGVTHWVWMSVNDGIQNIGDAAVFSFVLIIALIAYFPSLISYWLFGWANREIIGRAAAFWGLLLAILAIAFFGALFLFSSPFMALDSLTEPQQKIAFILALLMSAAVWVYPRFLIASGLLALGVFLIDKALFQANVMPV